MGRLNWTVIAGLVALGLLLGCSQPAPNPGARPADAGAANAPASAGGAGPASASSPSGASQPSGGAQAGKTSLVVGHFPATHTGGVYIAQERGYFAEQGLDVELVPFQSLPEAAVLLNSGQMDVYAGGTGANLYNAIARGIGLRAVADKAHSEVGVKYKAFVTRPDL